MTAPQTTIVIPAGRRDFPSTVMKDVMVPMMTQKTPKILMNVI